MNATIENLRIFLEERDIGGFLAAYETMVPGADVLSSQLTKITQQIFRRRTRSRRGLLIAGDTVRLWRLVRCGRLLVVDTSCSKASMHCLMPHGARSRDPDAPLPTKLLTYREAPEGSVPGRRSARPCSGSRDQPGRCGAHAPHRDGQRIYSRASAFRADLMTFRKSVCASTQPREFFRRCGNSSPACAPTPTCRYVISWMSMASSFVFQIDTGAIRGRHRSMFCYAPRTKIPWLVSSWTELGMMTMMSANETN